MNLIGTNEANCRDCYRCVRHCPVKAIQIKEGRAQVLEEKCLQEGHCVQVCPQDAKYIARGLERVQNWKSKGYHLFVSIAPSFVAAFPQYTPQQIVGALQALGCVRVEETVMGAEIVAQWHRNFLKETAKLPLISSACPSVVRLIERYHPHLVHHLVPVVSPLIAHGRRLKSMYPDPAMRIVFIGPCAAKKLEIREMGIKDAVDEAITFQELEEWLEAEGVDPASAYGEFAYGESQPSWARSFPVEGGLFKTAMLEGDLLREDIISVSGLEDLQDLLKSFPVGENVKLIEANACKGGCISGPGMPHTETGLILRRNAVVRYTYDEKGRTAPVDFPKDMPLDMEFSSKDQRLKPPGEAVIRELLARVGKKSEKEEYNCGACGYESCREKAVAVYHGIAEADMCMPYMRARAESFSNAILEATPNGIIVVDYNLQIQSLNPAAETMFEVQEEDIIDKPLHILFSPEPYKKALQKGRLLTRRGRYTEINLYPHEYIVPIPEQEIIVGIYHRGPGEGEKGGKETAGEELSQEKTDSIIAEQMKMAYEIAHLLEKTASETRLSLNNLEKRYLSKKQEKKDQKEE